MDITKKNKKGKGLPQSKKKKKIIDETNNSNKLNSRKTQSSS